MPTNIRPLKKNAETKNMNAPDFQDLDEKIAFLNKLARNFDGVAADIRLIMQDLQAIKNYTSAA